MAYLFAYLICILAHFRIDKFGIYLCGKDGFVPQHFLQGFQRHPFEDGQNGECVASDMRGDFGMAIALFAEKIAEFAIILELNGYSDCLKIR